MHLIKIDYFKFLFKLKGRLECWAKAGLPDALEASCMKEISSMLANFWWSSGVEKVKMHWLNWNRLKVFKLKGDMRFWDLEAFNVAILAKQLWCVLSNPQSVTTILKENYFKNQNVLEAKAKRNSSFAWKSLLTANDLLKQVTI